MGLVRCCAEGVVGKLWATDSGCCGTMVVCSSEKSWRVIHVAATACRSPAGGGGPLTNPRGGNKEEQLARNNVPYGKKQISRMGKPRPKSQALPSGAGTTRPSRHVFPELPFRGTS